MKTQGINPNDYNRGGYGKTDPPIEIYEYQPFFLLRRKDGTYSLLDGFRRLLWYNTPNHNINIRVYEEDELTSVQIMKLLVYLNHFKFYGGNGSYYDRGFSLAMKVIFGLSIPKYYNLFNAYLTLENTKRQYSYERVDDDNELTRVKERLVHPMFISDMKFAEGLLGSGVMINDIMGTLIHKMRTTYPDKELDPKMFLDKINSNKIILALQEKYKKIGRDETSAKGMEVINQLTPLYENILIENFGGTIEKTYAEKSDEVKKIIEDLKKDKTLTKFTGYQKAYLIDGAILQRLHDNKPIKFKCVVHPLKIPAYDSIHNKERYTSLNYGLLEYEIGVIKQETTWFGKVEVTFGFKDKDGEEFIFHDNYGGYHKSGKRMTHIRGTRLWGGQYEVDVFIDITKKEIEEYDKLRRIRK